MKRLPLMLASLFAVCLLSVSCGSGTPQTQEGEKSEPTQSEAPYFLLSELPDIGSYKNREKYDYFYDAPLNEFEPSDAYGSLAVYRVSRPFTDVMGGKTTADMYGFMTTDGKIITNAVYKYIDYYAEDGAAFFIAQKTGSGNTETLYKDYFSLISADGAKMISGLDFANRCSDGEIMTSTETDGFKAYSPQLEVLADFGKNVSLNEGETGMTPNYIGKIGENYAFFTEQWNDSEKISAQVKIFDAKGGLIKITPPMPYYFNELSGKYLFLNDPERRVTVILDTDGNYIADSPGWDHVYDSENDKYYFVSAQNDTTEAPFTVCDGKMNVIKTVTPDFPGSYSLSRIPPYGLFVYDCEEGKGRTPNGIAFYPAGGGEPQIYKATDDEKFYSIRVNDTHALLKYTVSGKSASLIDIQKNKELLDFSCDEILSTVFCSRKIIVITTSGELILIDTNGYKLTAKGRVPDECFDKDFAMDVITDSTVLYGYYNENTEQYVYILSDIATGEILLKSTNIRHSENADGCNFMYTDKGYSVTADERGNALVVIASSED